MAERPIRPSRRVEEPQVKEDEFNYEEDLRIDQYHLDKEFIDLPNLLMKYCKESAKANKATRYADENVKTIRSQIIKALKESGDKHTETTLEAGYRLDPSYIKAKQDWIEASFYSELCTNAVFAVQAKKLSIENLASLQRTELYSISDSIGKDSAENHIKERMRR